MGAGKSRSLRDKLADMMKPIQPANPSGSTGIGSKSQTGQIRQIEAEERPTPDREKKRKN